MSIDITMTSLANETLSYWQTKASIGRQQLETIRQLLQKAVQMETKVATIWSYDE